MILKTYSTRLGTSTKRYAQKRCFRAFRRKQNWRDSGKCKHINISFHCAGGGLEFCSKSLASGGPGKKWQPTPERNKAVTAWIISSACNKLIISSICICEDSCFWRTPPSIHCLGLVFLFIPEGLYFFPKRKTIGCILNCNEFCNVR